MEHNCTLLLHYDKAIPPNEDEISDLLTAKDVASKISGLKTLISLQLNGEAMPKQLMTVIRFCVPENDHMIKKLLLVYWEVVEKTGPDGKLLPEMILVCNNLRNDLSHPNEYIRGCTLRFLCKLKEAEILEPLIPTIKNNLEHRHSFVRRNGVLAVFAIFKSFDYLLPDGPELVEKVLQTVRHGDSSVRLKGAAATASSRELPPHRNLTLRASATPSSCSSRRRKSAPLLFFPKISTRWLAGATSFSWWSWSSSGRSCAQTRSRSRSISVVSSPSSTRNRMPLCAYRRAAYTPRLLLL
jgi:hypothetical protein